MTKFEKERRLLRRKILFFLVLIMNEVMIYFLGEKYFFDFKISVIGNFIRIIIGVVVILSILYYIKEKAINIEVKTKEK